MKKDRIMIKEIQKVEVEQEVIAVIKKEIEDQELKAWVTIQLYQKIQEKV